MASKPESRIVKKIYTMLQGQFPGFYFKTHGGLYQRVGLPDLIGVHKGMFIAIEVKCPGKEHTLTKNQIKTLKLIKSSGGIAFMATSPEEVKKLLRKEMKHERNLKDQNQLTQRKVRTA